MPISCKKRAEVTRKTGVNQESHGSAPNRNVVPITDQLIGECDGRADVLLGDPICFSNPLWTVPRGERPKDRSDQHTRACDHGLAVAAIGIHFDMVCNDVSHDFTSTSNCILMGRVGKANR